LPRAGQLDRLTFGSGAEAEQALGQKLDTIRSYWETARDQDRGLRM
jgi:hypothetical protein